MQHLAAFFAKQSSAIPNSEHLPSYKKLEMVILAGVEKGIWKPGELLPAERKLATAWGTSVGTVKRAMLELVHQGILFRRQGSGTYVASPSFTRQHRRYYLLLKNFGEGESANAIVLHSVKRIPGRPEINENLGLDAAEELWEVSRIFSEDGIKCVLSCSYFSALQFEGLDKIARNRFELVPLFILLEDDYNTPTLTTDELFGAVTAGPVEGDALDAPTGSPLLLIKSLMYTRNGQPFEYRLSYCATGNKYIFRTF